jgi:hypothetical protein
MIAIRRPLACAIAALPVFSIQAAPIVMRRYVQRLIQLVSLTAILAAPAATQVTYVAKIRFPLGGDGSWDYLNVDTAANRLFISRQDRFMVVDLASGKLVGEIPGLNAAHGAAFAYTAGHGFLSSGRDSTVTMFDLKTLKVLTRTIAAVDDDAILYDPFSRHVFTFNGDANSATALDAVTGRNLGSVALGGKPEFGATGGDGKLYVNISDKAEIVEISAAHLTVTRRWSIAPCQSPSGLAIDQAHHRLFSVCGNAVMAISNTVDGKLVTTVPIGAGVDATSFDSGTQLAFASNGRDGTLTVVHEDSPDKYSVAATIKTQAGSKTMTLDPRTHLVYLGAAEFGAVPAGGRGRAPVVPGSFSVLVFEKK